MLIDKNLLLADAQAFTATAVFTNSVDLGAANLEVGSGEPIGIAMAVGVAADHTTGDETYQLDALSDDASNLGSPTVICSRVITYDKLTAGSLHFLEFPPGTPIERYIGGRLTCGGTTPTITVDAWVCSQSMFARLAKSYPKNYSV